jgi:hypothetical protein
MRLNMGIRHKGYRENIEIGVTPEPRGRVPKGPAQRKPQRRMPTLKLWEIIAVILFWFLPRLIATIIVWTICLAPVYYAIKIHHPGPLVFAFAWTGYIGIPAMFMWAGD